MTRASDSVKVGWRSAPLIQSSEEFSTLDACLLETFEKGWRLLPMCAIDSVKLSPQHKRVTAFLTVRGWIGKADNNRG